MVVLATDDVGKGSLDQGMVQEPVGSDAELNPIWRLGALPQEATILRFTDSHVILSSASKYIHGIEGLQSLLAQSA